MYGGKQDSTIIVKYATVVPRIFLDVASVVCFNFKVIAVVMCKWGGTIAIIHTVVYLR